VALQRSARRTKAAVAACLSRRRPASLRIAEGFTPMARAAPQKNESHPRCPVGNLELRQSHLRWGLGGGEAAPSVLFRVFLAAKPPETPGKQSLRRSLKDFDAALWVIQGYCSAAGLCTMLPAYCRKEGLAGKTLEKPRFFWYGTAQPHRTRNEYPTGVL
jgi:hypothetical protein